MYAAIALTCLIGLILVIGVIVISEIFDMMRDD